MNYSRKKTEEDTKKIMGVERDRTTQNMVDAINAGERVRKIGGEVVYRDNNELGADLKGNTNEKMDTSENIGVVLKHDKQIVSRHTKTFTAGAVLVKEEEKKTSEDDSNVKT